MGRKRRSIGLEDPAAWVFNRMAEVYDARPPYPDALLEALVELAGQGERRVLDLGAGIGHLALPLAARGLAVTAVEPAEAMLIRLRQTCEQQRVVLRSFHAMAERLPFEQACFELALIADALHFIDSELAGLELRRVLVPRGTLAVVSCEFADTSFMNQVQALLDETTQRRARRTEQAASQLATVAAVDLTNTLEVSDETPVSPEQLERILCSVSFVGPAMNQVRYAEFRQRLHAIPGDRVWARRFLLQSGRRRRTTRGAAPRRRGQSGS